MDHYDNLGLLIMIIPAHDKTLYFPVYFWNREVGGVCASHLFLFVTNRWWNYWFGQMWRQLCVTQIIPKICANYVKIDIYIELLNFNRFSAS